jgi:hypothetical protein
MFVANTGPQSAALAIESRKITAHGLLGGKLRRILSEATLITFRRKNDLAKFPQKRRWHASMAISLVELELRRPSSGI